MKPTVHIFLYVLLVTLVSFLWHPNVKAQTPIGEGVYAETHETMRLTSAASLTPKTQALMAGFGHAEKSEAIRLASAGDADAFYKLGLSSLYGVNSTQNQKVAERFFFYAAKKGNPDAARYLAYAQLQNLQPKNIQPTQIKPAEVEHLKPIQHVNQTVSKKAAPTIKPVIKKKAVVSDIAAVQDFLEPAPIPEVPADKPEAEDVITPPTVESEADLQLYNSKSANVRSGYVSKPQSRQEYLIYLIIFFGVLVASSLIYFFVSDSIKTKKSLPEDFDKQVYLNLNPDVKWAKTNPAYHYLTHGKAEGRPYKY